MIHKWSHMEAFEGRNKLSIKILFHRHLGMADGVLLIFLHMLGTVLYMFIRVTEILIAKTRFRGKEPPKRALPL